MNTFFLLPVRPVIMHSARYLVLGVLVCAVLAASGCTTPAGPSAPAAPPLSAPAPAALALAPADVPAGYTLTGTREKNATEVSRLALDLGWKAGYVVTFTTTSAGPEGTGTIVQTITVYPEKSIPGVIGVIEKQERSDTGMTFADIPAPGIGDASGGFTARAQARLLLKTNSNGNPLEPESVQTEPVQDFAEVYFSKGQVLEVIRMTGPGSGAATVTALARAAYAKIP
jgi:hypothetical protein